MTNDGRSMAKRPAMYRSVMAHHRGVSMANGIRRSVKTRNGIEEILEINGWRKERKAACLMYRQCGNGERNS